MLDMVQSSNDAAMKDVTTKFREEEYVLGMVQKSKEGSCAPTKDAQTMPRKEGYVGDYGAIARRCKHEGCNKQVQNGGLCIRHGAEKYMCTIEGCTNHLQKNGVCIRLGAKKKRNGCS